MRMHEKLYETVITEKKIMTEDKRVIQTLKRKLWQEGGCVHER